MREAYARWAPSYPAEAQGGYMAVEQEAMLRLLPDLTGAVVLDLACGTGRYAKLARARGAAAAIGLDLSPDMLGRARVAAMVISVARGDLGALPFRDGAAGVIICGLAVGHLRDLGGAIAEFGRVLAPGGTLVYSDFHPAAYGAGRRRTFAADGREFAVEHHVHRHPRIRRRAPPPGSTSTPCSSPRTGRRPRRPRHPRPKKIDRTPASAGRRESPVLLS